MAVTTLSSEMMTTGERLGKAVGQEVLSFQRRDAPLEIQPRMHQQVGAWRIGKRDTDQRVEQGAPTERAVTPLENRPDISPDERRQ
jgi:hypothetical protein